METGILLESGTNELEILEFKVGSNYYGINVAKIKEILSYKEPTPIPNAHPCVEGIFMPRDVIISIIDLAKNLNLAPSTDKSKDMYIVTNFNNLNIAFHVHGVVGIHRVSWADIIKPDDTVNSAGLGVATGIIKIENRLIVILDFEKIVSDINPETGLRVSDIAHLGERERNNAPILMAEDSPLLGKLIYDSLAKAGYTNIKRFNDGLAAWNELSEYKANGTIKENVHCVITDIEMPQMDGHRLTKLIKDDNELKEVPVIIFSSLINDEMRRKGESLGADAQLTKPEIGKLVGAVDKLIY
ncbi:two-component system, chemotaxis family, response regulator CheV [Anaerosporobacter mobilis DSM 15930]|jgi:two-component system chemotaxis response regulator CheV|uniref:Stage 0 sporulation protein A homolog n=1 Tax=Anaerosporobacter mobilis DSM 15930 TaxID=1120996 RepID=A0A1M7H726_9FIRM|nr:chemotaxis protein [Anaerosporobacter mobilis]SHM23847.1 two-component system, chemotaxis family, response regulator CheV [Anaerosporobacter mobilis DSM 15930]